MDSEQNTIATDVVKQPYKANSSLVLLVVLLAIVVSVVSSLITAFVLKSHFDKELASIKSAAVQPQTQVLQPTQSPQVTYAQNVVDTTNWLVYTHPQEKISFKYPSDWKLEVNKDVVSVSKADSEGKGTYFVRLQVGDIFEEGAGSASDTFTVVETITLAGENTYILEDVGLYSISTCEAPKKCLLRAQNTSGKIDFNANHYNPGDQAVEPFPQNDPLTETALTIIKTITY